MRHPDDGREIARAPALPATVWYPKELALRELALREHQRGRRLLIYVSHVERRDLTPRLRRILEQAGLRVAVLKQRDAAAREREAWLQRQNAAGVDVLITNPALVKTGLDLTEYESIAFAEVDYSIFTVRQASKRSWRVGQTRPVEVVFFAYRDTMQATALSLVARKLRGALQLEGDTFDLGLAAADPTEDSLLTMLARALRTGEQFDDVERLFAEARQAEARLSQEIIVATRALEAAGPIAWSLVAASATTPGDVVASTATTVWTADQSTTATRPRLSLGDMADLDHLVTRPGRPRSRPRPTLGQLSFVELIDAPVSAKPGATPPRVEEDTAPGSRQLTLL